MVIDADAVREHAQQQARIAAMTTESHLARASSSAVLARKSTTHEGRMELFAEATFHATMAIAKGSNR